MVRRGTIFAALVFAVLLAACGLVIGLEPPEGTPLPPLVATDAGPPPADPCTHVSAPALPDTDDDANRELPPFWVALSRSRIAERDASTPGLDLDGVCTCDPSGPDGGTAHGATGSCITRGEAGVACDGPGGVDNEVEKLFINFRGIADPNGGFAASLAAGQRTVLIYLSKYNGLANDRDVGVAFALSDGLFTDECTPSLVVHERDAGVCTPGGYCTPSWRGCDRWHPAKAEVLISPLGEPVPRRGANGYVRDHTLVVQGDVDVPIFVGSSSLELTAPTFTARLEPVPRTSPDHPERFRMVDAIVAGRMPLDKFAGVLFQANFDAYFFCQHPKDYLESMGLVCPRADTRSASTSDFQPGMICDAVSAGIRFDTDVADIDRVETRAVPDSSGTDPCAGLTPPPLSELCPL